MPRVLQFADDERVQKGGGKPFDVLRLGRATLADDHTGTLAYWLYDARRNLEPINAKVMHPKLGKGQPGPIQIPRYTEAPDPKRPLACAWEEAGNDLTLTVGQAVHHWQKQPGTGIGDHYTLAGPHVNTDGGALIDGVTYLQGRGYAAFTEATDSPPDATGKPRKLTPADFPARYRGEVCQLIGGAAMWERKEVAWNVASYKIFVPGEKGDALAYSFPGKQGMTAFYSLLLNYASYSRLMAYYEGGNDYDRDDSIDEYGHAWQMLGCWVGGKVRAVVGVEHSYQARGYPILGAVLYYEA
jgi:hypothetical protein